MNLVIVIAITEGGVIPATLVYLGGFYKSTELATRLAWFWGIQVSTILVSSCFVFEFLIVYSRILQVRLVA